MMNAELTKNEELQALAIEIYRLASNDDTMSFEEAERLLEHAITKDTKEKMDLNKLYALYPVLEGRLRYVYSSKDAEINNAGSVSFDGTAFWFKAIDFTENEAIDLARTLMNGASILTSTESAISNAMSNPNTKDKAIASANRICTGFDAYLQDKNNYTGTDLLMLMKHQRNELV
jgi:hypothetical protein